jgi:hypothetical protein
VASGASRSNIRQASAWRRLVENARAASAPLAV